MSCTTAFWHGCPGRLCHPHLSLIDQPPGTLVGVYFSWSARLESAVRPCLFFFSDLIDGSINRCQTCGYCTNRNINKLSSLGLKQERETKVSSGLSWRIVTACCDSLGCNSAHMWCWSVSFFRNYVIMKDRFGERWLAESVLEFSTWSWHCCCVSQPGIHPGQGVCVCVSEPMSLLADRWDRLIRKWMANRNKSKRKINLNLNQSQTTDRRPDGAGIYLRITTDVLERQFYYRKES